MGSLWDVIRQPDPQRRFCSTLQTWEWNVSCQHGKTTFGCSWLDISMFPWKDFGIFTWTFLENGLFSLWNWYLWWFLSFQKPQKMQLLSGGKFVKLFLKRLWVLQIAAKCTWRGGSIDKLIPPPLVDVNNGVEHVELNSFGGFYGVLVWVVVWLPTSENNPQVSFHIEGKRAMFWVLGAQEGSLMNDG